MKNIIMVICVTAVLWFCSCDKAPEYSQSDTPKDITPPKVEAIIVFELKSVFIDTNFNTMGKFRFRHNKKQPIMVDGFRFVDDEGNPTDSSNVFRVGFVKYKRKESGEWVNVYIGYCRYGRKKYPIQPNQDYTFLIPIGPFTEKGTHGIIGVSGDVSLVESKPFETIEIQRIAKQ